MRSVAVVFVIVFFVVVAHAQQTNPPCPNIEITGPGRVSNPGETLTFSVTLSSTPESIKYLWKVSHGVIEVGQGTQSIVVKTSRADGGQNVAASVLVEGIPSGCNGTATEIGPVAPALEYGSVDEWSRLPNDDQRGRLDNFFTELSNNPNHNGLIFIYTQTKEGKLAKDRWMKFILNHVKFRKFDKSRLVFGFEAVDDHKIILFRYWPGDEREICAKCKFVYGRDLKVSK